MDSIIRFTFVVIFLCQLSQGVRVGIRKGKCEITVKADRKGYSILKYSSKAQEECSWILGTVNRNQAIIYGLVDLEMVHSENGVKTCTGEVTLPNHDEKGCQFPKQVSAYVTPNSDCRAADILSQAETSQPSEILVRAAKSSSMTVYVKSLSQKSKSLGLKVKVIDCRVKPKNVSTTVTKSPPVFEKLESGCRTSGMVIAFVVVIVVLIIAVLALGLGIWFMRKRHARQVQNSDKSGPQPGENELNKNVEKKEDVKNES